MTASEIQIPESVIEAAARACGMASLSWDLLDEEERMNWRMRAEATLRAAIEPINYREWVDTPFDEGQPVFRWRQP